MADSEICEAPYSSSDAEEVSQTEIDDETRQWQDFANEWDETEWEW